jgi:ribosome assembly protein YihI (activator of Der GTPase)
VCHSTTAQLKIFFTARAIQRNPVSKNQKKKKKKKSMMIVELEMAQKLRAHILFPDGPGSGSVTNAHSLDYSTCNSSSRDPNVLCGHLVPIHICTENTDAHKIKFCFCFRQVLSV